MQLLEDPDFLLYRLAQYSPNNVSEVLFVSGLRCQESFLGGYDFCPQSDRACQIPEQETTITSLNTPLPDWRRIPSPTVYQYSRKGPLLVVHHQCWELLQAQHQKKTGKGISPRDFWDAAIIAKSQPIDSDYDGFIPSSKWKNSGQDLNMADMWSLPSDIKLKKRFQAAFWECRKTGILDKQIQNDFWYRMQAWYFFCIDE